MASSGSLTTSGYTYQSNSSYKRTMKLAWSLDSQSVANNTSTISWTLTGSGNGTGYVIGGGFTVVINGKTVYSSSDSINVYSGTTVASGTTTIKHGSDGTKTFSASVTGWLYYNDSGNVSGSKSWTLPQIQRASSITSAASFSNAENPSMVITSISTGSIAATLTVNGTTIATRTIGTGVSSYTFSLSTTERNNLYAATASVKSATAVYSITTTVSGTTVGTSTLSKTYSVGSAPSLTVSTPVDTNSATVAITGDSSYFIAGMSTMAPTYTAAATYGASIKSVTLNGNTFTSGQDVFTVYNGYATCTFIATDSRGYTTTVTKNLNVQSYTPLYISAEVYLSTAGEATISGSGGFYSGKLGTTANTKTVDYRYKASTAENYSDWITLGTTDTGDTFKLLTTTITGLDYKLIYNFQIRVTDRVDSKTQSISVTSTPLFDWGKSDFHFHVPTHFKKPLVLDENTDDEDYGTGNYFKYMAGGSEATSISFLTGQTTLTYPQGLDGNSYTNINNYNGSNTLSLYGQKATSLNLAASGGESSITVSTSHSHSPARVYLRAANGRNGRIVATANSELGYWDGNNNYWMLLAKSNGNTYVPRLTPTYTTVAIAQSARWGACTLYLYKIGKMVFWTLNCTTNGSNHTELAAWTWDNLAPAGTLSTEFRPAANSDFTIVAQMPMGSGAFRFHTNGGIYVWFWEGKTATSRAFGGSGWYMASTYQSV